MCLRCVKIKFLRAQLCNEFCTSLIYGAGLSQICSILLRFCAIYKILYFSCSSSSSFSFSILSLLESHYSRCERLIHRTASLSGNAIACYSLKRSLIPSHDASNGDLSTLWCYTIANLRSSFPPIISARVSGSWARRLAHSCRRQRWWQGHHGDWNPYIMLWLEVAKLLHRLGGQWGGDRLVDVIDVGFVRIHGR